MPCDFHSCLTAAEVKKPAILFAAIRQMENTQGQCRSTTDVPELGNETQKHEFCDIYDELINHL